MIVISLALALTMLGTSQVRAEHSTYNRDWHIVVEGNKKTRDKFMYYLARACLEKARYSELDIISTEEVRACMIDTKLFSHVYVEVSYPDVLVKVTERSTIIPIPYARSSNGYTTYGMFIYESNLLGSGKTLIAGAAHADAGNSFYMMYSDPSFKFTDWGYKVKVISLLDDATSERDGIAFERITSKGELLGVAVNYKLTPKLRVEGGLDYFSVEYEVVDSGNGIVDYESFSNEFELMYNATRYRFYFDEGLYSKAWYLREFHRSDSESIVSRWEGLLKWEKNLLEKNALQVMLRYKATNGDNSYEAFNLGYDRGYRGVQYNTLWATDAYTVSVDYQIPFTRKRYGTWTVAPYYDKGWFNPVHDIGVEEYESYGVGIYLYLRKIAMPGLGIVVGRNENFMGDYVAFSLGFTRD